MARLLAPLRSALLLGFGRCLGRLFRRRLGLGFERRLGLAELGQPLLPVRKARRQLVATLVPTARLISAHLAFNVPARSRRLQRS